MPRTGRGGKDDSSTAPFPTTRLIAFTHRLSNVFGSVQVVHPYSSIDTIAAWKKLRFILLVRSDFHMIDSLSVAVHAFISRVSISFSVDETLLPRKVNLSTSLRELLSSMEMSPV